MVSGHPHGAAICTVGGEQTLGRPVIQYRETDWAFLIRMASHFGGVVVPETSRSLPRVWFGFPERSYPCQFDEDAYTSDISQRYYELGGAAAGLDKADFFYYDVKSWQNCDLGWHTIFQGKPFLIMEKHAILDCGEVIFTYRLGSPGLGWNVRRYNPLFSGLTLLGEVLETERETLKLKLDIDEGWEPGGSFPYTWRPETGNLMYCMPQMGTRVSLYIPGWDEQEAMAIHCVRTNGDSCERMSDPSRRSFVSEHGKELNLYPEEMSLVGAQGLVGLSDENGIVIQSRKPVVIVGQSVTFEAPVVDIQAPAGEVVMAQGQPGGSQASLMMSSRYDLLAMAHTQAEGWNQVSYEPFDDTPQPGKFEWGGLIGNVLAGIAVAACVGAAVAASTLFFPAVIAAVAGTAVASSAVTAAYVTGGLTALAGSAAAIGTGLKDIANGQVRDQTVYQNNACQVAVTTGGVLQTLHGAYDLVKFVTQVPNILNKFGKVLSSSGNSGSGRMHPALAGAGANGGMSVIGGTVEVGAVLTREQLFGLAQGLGLTNAGSIMFAKRAEVSSPVRGKGGSDAIRPCLKK